MARKKNQIEDVDIATAESEQPVTTVVINDAEAFINKLQETKNRINIKKAKMMDDLFLYVEYSDESATVKRDCKDPIHDDLKFQFRKLDDHLSRLCEQYNERGELDTFNVNCKGFTIGGSGDHEGVCLIGYRGFDTGKCLNLVSPFQKWDDSENYEYVGELAEIIEACKYEVMQYLFEGKHQPSSQMELEFPEGEEAYSETNL